MTATSIFERTARNERWIVLTGLLLVAAAGLSATLQLGDVLMMPISFRSRPDLYIALLFLMWWTMMMAMMLPSAAPAILTFAAVSRKLSDKRTPALLLAAFVAGYVAIWTVFSVAAVALQVLASENIALSMMMAVNSAAISGGLLIAAGIYQMTPLKYACLLKCQAPLMFFARNWRKGGSGAFRMGLSHGLYCVGCCWVLMGLLFYGGVMELRWITGIALYVAAEKIIPARFRLSRFVGLFLVAWGAWSLVAIEG